MTLINTFTIRMLTWIERPKNWFREYPILRLNFIFWVIVYRVANSAFKGLNTVADVLIVKDKKELPFFRIVTPEGPYPNRVLTFSSLWYNNTSLAQR
ncbi:uncharacterized protein N7483_008031 [Penicillium malachiteum]|uniref:uncharacterized protein n=1 Tax=Penicillium malachiteum TaxID=1324776 RepID=UPI00254944DC|nr:uncharacterized protein N7483_008031 [Penicillium malachiteum]KAJ5726674.1 hypothetical protein N7483_008031 [Penicillium malachiteum]